MPPRETILKILEAGVQAPSGSNSQPWRFIVKKDYLEIIALPEKDHQVLNYKNRGTYIAHGALIENIELASLYFGYQPQIEIFPEKDNLNLTARIKFELTEKKDELYEAIFKRCTNRKPYEIKPLTLEEKKYLFESNEILKKYPKIEIKFIENREKIQKIAPYLVNDMKVYLQNELLHKLLFKEVIFDDKDYQKEGLFYKTLEVKSPELKVFKLLKNWKICKFLNKLSISNKIKESNAKVINSSACLIAFIIKDENERTFINCGRVIENIWLRAINLNLSCQLVTGVLFLYQRGEDTEIFNDKEISFIKESYLRIKDMVEIDSGLITAFLRIGKSSPPSATSYKKPPEIKWEE